MTTKKKIVSIEEFDGKNYQIKFVEQEDKAVITHYLHNVHNGVSKHYKEDALKVIKNFVEYKKDENIDIVEEDALQQLLFEVENVPFPTPENYKFKFIDLFAGIGGFRLALQNIGGKCVYTSEWENAAKKTYRENFGEIPQKNTFLTSLKFYVQVFLVKHFQSQEIEKVLQIQEELYFLT